MLLKLHVRGHFLTGCVCVCTLLCLALLVIIYVFNVFLPRVRGRVRAKPGTATSPAHRRTPAAFNKARRQCFVLQAGNFWGGSEPKRAAGSAQNFVGYLLESNSMCMGNGRRRRSGIAYTAPEIFSRDTRRVVCYAPCVCACSFGSCTHSVCIEWTRIHAVPQRDTREHNTLIQYV